ARRRARALRAPRAEVRHRQEGGDRHLARDALRPGAARRLPGRARRRAARAALGGARAVSQQRGRDRLLRARRIEGRPRGVPAWRARRIHGRLGALRARPNPKPAAEELAAIEQDIESVEARDLAPKLAALCPTDQTPEVCDAVGRFDGRFSTSSFTALPYTL